MAYEYESEIRNEREWTAYTLKIDSRYGVYFNHEKPGKYPVRVCSNKIDDNDGRIADENCIDHTFTYRQIVKCEHCGHEMMTWPDGGVNANH